LLIISVFLIKAIFNVFLDVFTGSPRGNIEARVTSTHGTIMINRDSLQLGHIKVMALKVCTPSKTP